jgi:hypothetical protein
MSSATDVAMVRCGYKYKVMEPVSLAVVAWAKSAIDLAQVRKTVVGATVVEELPMLGDEK